MPMSQLAPSRLWRRARNGVARRVRRASEARLSEGALTTALVQRWCRGRGAEIGPGSLPETVKHGAPGRAVLIDRFPAAPRGQTAGLVCADAARLPLAGESLEFLVSAHCLEHCPDVLAVLREWRRVLRPGAALVLVLPHVDRTFDHGRPTSDYDHHVADLGVVGDGTDDAHWADWEQFSIPQHDHEWLHDEGARRADGSWDRQYLVQHGDVHFHAWTQHEMVEILFRNGFFIRDVAELLPERDNSFMVVVTRPAE